MDSIIPFTKFQTKIIQSQKLTNYIFVILTTTSFLLILTMQRIDGWTLDVNFHDLDFVQVAIGILILLTAFLAIMAKNRILTLLFLGIVGLGTTFVFIIFGAIDLAITQLVIELLLLIFFLMSVYKMPPIDNYSSKLVAGRDLIISIILGITFTFVVLKANKIQIDSPVSDFYTAYSYLKANGKNIVNVIIVDFRALDTLGEITVLLLVAMGIPTMLKKNREDDNR